MISRPILFQGAMVRALLDGSKTQTRRVVKGKALDTIDFMSNSVDEQDGSTEDLSQGWHEGQLKVWSTDYPEEGSESIHCPYGQPGDQLWVRESWSDNSATHVPGVNQRVYYRADYPEGYYKNVLRWRPSIHMPRWASRITLEITRVRVERLHAINEVAAIAEGAAWAACGSPQEGSHKAGYAQLWESINGAGSWAANPWVWVVEFKVVKP